MQSNTESEYLDANSVIQAYPISAFASSALQFQTITGDTELRCAVSLFYFCATGFHQFSSSERSWVKSLEKRLHLGHIDTTRETPHLVHRLVFPMPLRIGWCLKGPILGTFFICVFSLFSSRLLTTNIHTTPALMDRKLSLKWHQLRMPLLQNWLPIGSHSSVLATQISIDYRVRLSGLCTWILHALFYSKAQALQQL